MGSLDQFAMSMGGRRRCRILMQSIGSVSESSNNFKKGVFSVEKPSRKRMVLRVGILILALGLLMSVKAPLTCAIDLADGNSTVSIDPDNSGGLYSWTVNGTEQIFQEWFHYSLGTAESYPLTSTEGNSYSGFNLTTTGGTNTLGLAYDNINTSNPDLGFKIDYTLSGGLGGSNYSKLVESIQVRNSTSDILHFYMYTDFDLAYTFEDDSAVRLSPNAFLQTDPTGIFSLVTSSVAPNNWEIGYFSDLLDKFGAGTPDLTGMNSPLGPGDLSYAFQWDIAAGDTLALNIDKSIATPEPGTLVLFGTGLVVLMLTGRKKLTNNKC